MKNRLKYHSAYLIGPMDDVADRGVEWREDISEFLHKFEIGVLNPCDKAIGDADEDNEAFQNRQTCKALGEYDSVTRVMKNIVSVDLHMVDLSNFVIAYIDRDAHMCGSYSEITYAALERKPIIVCCKQGKANIPDWIYGIADHRLFFDNWQNVKSYILKIAFLEEIKHMGKWRFFDYDKVFGKKDNKCCSIQRNYQLSDKLDTIFESLE